MNGIAPTPESQRQAARQRLWDVQERVRQSGAALQHLHAVRTLLAQEAPQTRAMARLEQGIAVLLDNHARLCREADRALDEVNALPGLELCH